MSILKGQDRIFNLNEGNVLTTGGSLNLADGQLAIVDLSLPNTQNGRRVVNTFAGKPADTNFEIKLGVPPLSVTRSFSDKAWSSLPFKLSEVVDYKVFAPKVKGIETDEFIIGYNGKAGTEIVLKQGESDVIEVTLWGDAMAVLGYQDAYFTAQIHIEYPYVREDGTCVDCTNGVASMQEIIERAVENFKGITLMGGVPITDYIEITPVNSLSPSLAAISDEVPYTTFELVLTDRGRESDLGNVQAQYNDYQVFASERVGDDQTKYTILAPTGTTLANYVTSTASYIKDCEDCTTGYTATVEGVVYSVSIEDDGVDLTTTVDDLPGFVTGTVIKQAQNGGVGIYTLVTDNELTEAEIATFKAATAIKGTAVITLVGDASSVCVNPTTVATAWTAGDTCNAVPEVYRITLADDDCGENKLAELQAAYPTLVIAVDSASLSRTATLTGTSGTANVNIAGVNYLATYNTSLTQTATDFITANKAAIETATGGTITSSAATLILVAPSATYPSFSVTNASGTLAGTVAAAVASGAAAEGLCQTTYRTTVLSDIVCEECSPEFRDLFISEAPHDYERVSWEKTSRTYNPLAKMGIRVKAKPFVLSGDEEYRDDMPFYATSTRISIAGGEPTFVNESFVSGVGRFAVKLINLAEEPEALGGMMRDFEDRSRRYFEGTERLYGNNYGKWQMGQETRLKGLAQYVDYALTVSVKTPVQHIGESDQRITYIARVEVGKHQAVETLFNKLAAAAGLPAQRAYAI